MKNPFNEHISQFNEMLTDLEEARENLITAETLQRQSLTKKDGVDLLIDKLKSRSWAIPEGGFNAEIASLQNHIQFYENELEILRRLCTHKHENGKLAVDKSREPINFFIEEDTCIQNQRCKLCGGVIIVKVPYAVPENVKEEIRNAYQKRLVDMDQELSDPEPEFKPNLQLNPLGTVNFVKL